ncbi:peptidylprolyl isomerase [Clostridium sp.]|uniref:peptidylprolyl isomerase n=1 Tax=Clostridium sp. TaxID=1506 RepID=UPI003216268C
MQLEDDSIIKIELYPDIAPNTVRNFITLANDKFYDGLIFHRVIPGFMIQGGDPAGNGSGGPDYSIYGEFSKNNFENSLLHERGVISMARAKDKNSGGSQFFIMHEDSPHLDGDYAGFGKVIEGIDIVDKIAASETKSDKPLTDIKIKTITVDTFGVKYNAPTKYTK